MPCTTHRTSSSMSGPWGCDFLACSAYKFYGPHVGVLYGKHERLEELDVPKLQPAPDTVPDRLETGTQNHEGIVGAAAAVDYLASLATGPIGIPTLTRRQRLSGGLRRSFTTAGRRSAQQLWDGLSGIQGVRLYGPPPSAPRTPTLALDGRELARPRGLPAPGPSGNLCVSRQFLRHDSRRPARTGTDGLVRIGCACYTTDEEVDRVIAGIRAIASSIH